MVFIENDFTTSERCRGGAERYVWGSPQPLVTNPMQLGIVGVAFECALMQGQD
jgi:hypothetical protein